MSQVLCHPLVILSGQTFCGIHGPIFGLPVELGCDIKSALTCCMNVHVVIMSHNASAVSCALHAASVARCCKACIDWHLDIDLRHSLCQDPQWLAGSETPGLGTGKDRGHPRA